MRFRDLIRLGRMTCHAIAVAFLLAPATAATAQASDKPGDAQALYEKAYIFGLPIIMSYKTMYLFAIDKNNDQYKAPPNQLFNVARAFGPQDTAVVSVNADTPYSILWADLRAEPLVLCAPKIEKDRYYSVMLQDMSTNLLPYIGTRTTGNDGGCYMLAGPDWSGKKPDGVATVANAATDFVFVVYRTQLFGPDDLDNVKKIQAGYKVQTLSEFAGTSAPDAAQTVTPPAWNEEAATGDEFINFLNFNLQFIRPTKAESKLLESLGPIGVGAGREFSFDALSPDMQAALRAGIKSALEKISAQVRKQPVLAGDTAEGYGEDWLRRAAITQQGWGANSSEEASYPNYADDADGDPLDASTNNYTITFSKGQLPPVNAFWSLTMYDAKTQLMIENPLDRYLLNSTMLEDMTTGPDGSLTLYVQKASPGKDKEANWLPAPDGPFYMLMRLYWPKKAFLEGKWKQPPVDKAE